MAEHKIYTGYDFIDGGMDNAIEEAVDLYGEYLNEYDNADDALYDAVVGAIEDKFMFYDDQLSAVMHYGKTTEAFQLVFDELTSDIMDGVHERIGDGNE